MEESILSGPWMFPPSGRTYNLFDPKDLSIPLEGSEHNPVAWYLDAPKVEPVQMGEWIGSVSLGASVNFNNLAFNPHAHATHTESLGHIVAEELPISLCFRPSWCEALLVSARPEQVGGDQFIAFHQIPWASFSEGIDALVLRTLPNDEGKRTRHYSNTNPPYVDPSICTELANRGVRHLLVDLPSVDKEVDSGALRAHKAFWQWPQAPRRDAFITEFIYVPNALPDGLYLLHMQVMNIRNDAAPSRPVLYPRMIT
jgi:arylformamidase